MKQNVDSILLKRTQIYLRKKFSRSDSYFLHSIQPEMSASGSCVLFIVTKKDILPCFHPVELYMYVNVYNNGHLLFFHHLLNINMTQIK